MKITDTKTLLAFVFEQMEKLDRKEINTDTANSQAKLCQQANNTIRLEYERVKLGLAKFSIEIKEE